MYKKIIAVLAVAGIISFGVIIKQGFADSINTIQHSNLTTSTAKSASSGDMGLDGSYQVFGANLTIADYEGPDYTGGLENIQEQADNFTLIGYGYGTGEEQFDLQYLYTDVLITFGNTPIYGFDSAESDAATIGYDADGNEIGYYIHLSNVFDDYENDDLGGENFLGPADDNYITTIPRGSRGHILFRFRGDGDENILPLGIVTITAFYLGEGSYCGDGVCNENEGESCSSCPGDCGGCDSGDGGGGGSGCFIATACYGTPMAYEVRVLSRFRDECLLTNPVGKIFVNTYYKISPPIADFIRQHPLLKNAVRETLKPLIWMAKENQK